VLHPLSLDIAHKEFLVLVGPSGCGKSTLLRMIAGLEDVTSGTIAIEGRVVNEVEPKDRDIAMVFQDYALYPHMTVYDNIAFGLLYRGTPKDEIRRRVEEAAGILNITEYLKRRPRQLSGGQRQRVAMGRAIVRDPKCFCSTSRCPTSTPSCACRCGPRSRSCISVCRPPPSTSPTTRSRR
jgi:ABC-type sugar transport system ATPase subunit